MPHAPAFARRPDPTRNRRSAVGLAVARTCVDEGDVPAPRGPDCSVAEARPWPGLGQIGQRIPPAKLLMSLCAARWRSRSQLISSKILLSSIDATDCTRLHSDSASMACSYTIAFNSVHLHLLCLCFVCNKYAPIVSRRTKSGPGRKAPAHGHSTTLISLLNFNLSIICCGS